MTHWTTILIVLLLGSAAWAGDGVVEINQTCAVQTGCFSGDAAGFPVTIDASAGRSYRLTSDLSVDDPNTDGILIANSRVSIDFNGFSLTGFSIGSGAGIGVTGTGINGSVAGFANISGGTIRGFRSWGVDLRGAIGVVVENMSIQSNLIGGVALGAEARIVGNQLSDNGGTSGDSISLSGERGFIARNSILDSGRYGIFAVGSTLIAENVVAGFGTTAIVAANFGNSVRDCVIRNDGGGTGLAFGDVTSAYRGNTISAVATTVLAGRDVGGNVCNASLTCP